VDGDVLIVGAGAAGLTTAIFLARLRPHCRIVLVDGARRPGAKILVSGGGRCNVTNVSVTEHDFHGGSRAVIRQVLRSLPVDHTIAFFRDLGVPLHEEANGKLFPDSNRARDVLDALLHECERTGVERRDGCRVTTLHGESERFVAGTSQGPLATRRVVLATGGRSLPKSGSDGTGWEIARAFGHTIVPPVPALVPLLLAPDSAVSYTALSGVSHEVEIAVWVSGRITHRVRGSLLWTHFGISGPAALDVSRHWTRASQQGLDVRLTLSVVPGSTFERVDERLLALAAGRPRASMPALLVDLVPAAVAAELLKVAAISASDTGRMLTRDARRRLAHALTEIPLPVTGTRGYNYAEVTAGGVPLSEVNGRTLESRLCDGLYFTGEVLDVDGRLGGFNFQWAWSSAMTVARALAAAFDGTDQGVDTTHGR
jgi:predicted Rossmann fold flavoprotein